MNEKVCKKFHETIRFLRVVLYISPPRILQLNLSLYALENEILLQKNSACVIKSLFKKQAAFRLPAKILYIIHYNILIAVAPYYDSGLAALNHYNGRPADSVIMRSH